MAYLVPATLALALLASPSLPNRLHRVRPHATDGAEDAGQEQGPKQRDKNTTPWLLRSQRADGSWPSPKGKHDQGVTALACLGFLAEGSGFDEKGKPRGYFGESILRARHWLSQQVLACATGKKGITVSFWDQVLTCYALVECDGQAKKESQATKVLLQQLLASKTLRRELFESGAGSEAPAQGQARTSTTVSTVDRRALLRTWFFVMLQARKDLGFKTDPAFPKATRRWAILSGKERSPYVALCRLMYGITMTRGKLTEQGRQDAKVLLQHMPRLYAPEAMDFEFCYLATLALYQVGNGSWNTWKKPLVKGLHAYRVLEGESKGSFSSTNDIPKERGPVFTTALAWWSLGFPSAWGLHLLR